MQKEDIRLRQVIIHIMDSTMGMPVLSDQVIDFGSDFGDFLRAHIFRLLESDDMKKCSFDEDSKVQAELEAYNEENFIPVSQKLGELLYGVMNKNIDIPPADLLVVEYEVEQQHFLCAETIARKMAVSRTTLNRLFQKKIGWSPGQYLLEYRLQQSEKLLQMGMTVKQTALSCGFEDPFYYSRVFRKHYGMPPSDYRLQFAEIQ